MLGGSPTFLYGTQDSLITALHTRFTVSARIGCTLTLLRAREPSRTGEERGKPMSFADTLALALLLLVGGYIFAVGVLPQIFSWLLSHLTSSRPSHDSHSRPISG
jgi:hypothetical protein